MATVSEITEKECVKELPRTRQRDFELCSIAQPSQHRLNACLWQRIGQDITFFDRYQIILFGQRGMFNNNNNNNVMQVYPDMPLSTQQYVNVAQQQIMNIQ